MKSYLEVAEDIKQKRLVIVLEEFMPDFIKGRTTDNTSNKPSQNLLNSADLHVVYPSRQHQPKRVKAFIEALLVYFKALEKGGSM